MEGTPGLVRKRRQPGGQPSASKGLQNPNLELIQPIGLAPWGLHPTAWGISRIPQFMPLYLFGLSADTSLLIRTDLRHGINGPNPVSSCLQTCCYPDRRWSLEFDPANRFSKRERPAACSKGRQTPLLEGNMKQNTVNQQFLINEVRKKGVTARKAKQIVQVVFAAWKDALAHSIPAETPCGVLRVVSTKGKPRREHKKLKNINTKQTQFYDVLYPGEHQVVKLRPNRKLDLTPACPLSSLPESPPPSRGRQLPPRPPAPPSPPSETAEERECRRLAGEFLGGIEVDAKTMAHLQRAVQRDPSGRRPERPPDLLRVLQWMKRNVGRRCLTPADLFQEISESCWIRMPRPWS